MSSARVHPEFAAATMTEMIEHLSSVHLPIYIGVFCVVLTTALALLDQIERSERDAPCRSPSRGR